MTAPVVSAADSVAETQYLVNEIFSSAPEDPSAHPVPSVSEWKSGQTTARITYEDGRVYFDKLNSGAYSADMLVPFYFGYADGREPVCMGTPETDLYVEFDWKAHNTSTRLYIKGLDSNGKGTNLFYITQSGNNISFSKHDNSASVKSSITAKQTDRHIIRLFMERKSGTYTISGLWIDGEYDKNPNLTASSSCRGLYALAVDERRNSGTGLGSSFGSLKVWQTAKEQLKSLINEAEGFTFDDIKGENLSRDDVTENLNLITGVILENGIMAADWKSSDESVVSTDGTVTRPMEADISVTLTPVYAMMDIIGDGSNDFVPGEVQAEGSPIVITVLSNLLDVVKEQITFDTVKGGNVGSDNVKTDLNLPKELNGIDIVWKLKSMTPDNTAAQIDTESGYVVRPAKDEEDVSVVLTAVLSRGILSAEKDISFKIVKMELNDDEYLYAIAEKLSFADISGINTDEKSIVSDLILPIKYNGADIEWTSSNAEVISETGKVTQPIYPKTSENVTITAKLAFGNAKQIAKIFEFTVLPCDPPSLADSTQLKTNIRGATADALANLTDRDMQTFIEIPAKTKEFYIMADLGSNKNLSRFEFVTDSDETSIKSFEIETSENETDWNTVFSGMAAAGENKIDFIPVNSRYIRLLVTEKAAAAEKLFEIAVRYCPEERAAADADAKSLALDLPERITASSIILPTNGIFGSDIEWSFEPEDVFTKISDGNYKVNHGTNDKTVTFTATFKNGSAAAKLKRTYSVSGNGGSSSGGSSSGGSSGSGNKAIGIVIPPASNITNNMVKNTFDDLSSVSWAVDYIEKLYENGIINGKSERIFAPLDFVTREEFVKMLVLAIGENNDAKGEIFSDVAASEWYASYIYSGVKSGIVNGVSDSVFGIGMNISREDMAVLSARAYKLKTGITNGYSKTDYKDNSDIADYAEESVEMLSGLGLLSGNDNGEFLPKNYATRAEAAKVLYLLREAIRKG